MKYSNPFMWILVCLSAQFFFNPAYGQTPLPISYSYDASGNRTVRKVLELADAKTDVVTAPTDSILEDNAYYTDKMQTIGLRVYPNPTAGKVSIELENAVSDITYKVCVFNSQGLPLITHDGTGTHIELNLSHFPDGIYTSEITAGNERTIWRIIKK